jgi:hypothetical protein|tara:strand:+ start:867 stop:1037 length:171 start_codon:yes stop_codon:yes gene_type:complete
MATNRKSFNKRILLGGKIGRRVEFSRWNNELRPKAAVAVDTKGLVMLTTIGLAETA